VPASINDLSTTASSNSPAGSETPTEGDNYIRSYGSFIALLRDKLNGTSATGTVKEATFSGTMAGAASWSGLQTFAAGLAGTTATLTGALIASNFAGTTYTPTLTALANVTGTTARVCQYIRIGSVVHVSGQMDVDPTSDATPVEVGISLPVASDFAQTFQCAGTGYGFDGSTVGRSAGILGDVTNNRATMAWVELNGAGNKTWSFSFTYLIV
jgi:hypothetical protein